MEGSGRSQVWMRRRRLLVSGGGTLSPAAAELWRALGRMLAAEDGVVVMTGGLAARAKAPGIPSADRSVIDGMKEALATRGIDPGLRIETFTPAEDQDKPNRFKEGRVHVLYNRTRQSRRFSMVRAADVVIALGGSHGTGSIIDAALAQDRPVLPVPSAGGESADRWEEIRAHAIAQFAMTPHEVAAVERVLPDTLSRSDADSWAAKLLPIVMRGFTKTCFVIMPFASEFDPVYDQAIVPALKSRGITPVRTDRDLPAGNIIEAIREGIRHSYFTIADTSGFRPNVMYELGLAHADDKPVLLLSQLGPDGQLPKLPFDIGAESTIGYVLDDSSLTALRQRIEGAMAKIWGV